MIAPRVILRGVLFLTAGVVLLAGLAPGQEPSKQVSAVAPAAAASASLQNDETLRLEGEKRFSANCGRCHQAPHKFPPRMMATIVRHMRVRATITDEDMRLILRYMTQ
jgi:hypothetical protein